MERLKVVPLVQQPQTPARLREAEAAARRRFLAFDLHEGECFTREEKDHLISTVESGFENFDCFNRVCSRALVRALDEREGARAAESRAT